MADITGATKLISFMFPENNEGELAFTSFFIAVVDIS